jgi:hypothetical protein
MEDYRGEYTRKCPYCLETFVATHLNRFYCSEKNGVKNFCKHRMKRLNQNIEEVKDELKSTNKRVISIHLLEEEIQQITTTDERIKESMIQRNIRILEDILSGESFKLINSDDLTQKGFYPELYSVIETNDKNNKYPVYGEYKVLPLVGGDVFIGLKTLEL